MSLTQEKRLPQEQNQIFSADLSQANRIDDTSLNGVLMFNNAEDGLAFSQAKYRYISEYKYYDGLIATEGSNIGMSDELFDYFEKHLRFANEINARGIDGDTIPGFTQNSGGHEIIPPKQPGSGSGSNTEIIRRGNGYMFYWGKKGMTLSMDNTRYLVTLAGDALILSYLPSKIRKALAPVLFGLGAHYKVYGNSNGITIVMHGAYPLPVAGSYLGFTSWYSYLGGDPDEALGGQGTGNCDRAVSDHKYYNDPCDNDD